MNNFLNCNFNVVEKHSTPNICRIEWTYKNPKSSITVKEVISNILSSLDEKESRIFRIIPTECEYYNGDCWTRLDRDFNVLSNNISRNDIEPFYEYNVKEVKYSDEWGYIEISITIDNIRRKKENV